MRLFVIIAVFFGIYGATAHAQSSKAEIAEKLKTALSDQAAKKQLRLRMFADRNGDLYWMDTNSIVPTANGDAEVIMYFVKDGYPSERQQLTAACCGRTLSTRAPEGTPAYFRFDCHGNYTYTVNFSPPLYAAPLSMPYNIAQFACGGARCKINGSACLE